MNNSNALKGSNHHQEVDISLFPKDPSGDHSDHHHRSFELGFDNQSRESRERRDSILTLKEGLKARSALDTADKKAVKPSTGITPSPSTDDLVGLNFQLEIHRKSLTVPNQTFHRHSVSLPVSPKTSPKIERKSGGLLRKLSSTNLKQMGVLSEHSSTLSGGQVARKDKDTLVRRDSQMKIANTKDVVDSASLSSVKPSSQTANASWLVSSGFGNWLKKKTNLDNKEMNAMAPSF